MMDVEDNSILVRYLNNNSSAAERLIVDRWYEDMEHNGPDDDSDVELLEIRLWSRIANSVRHHDSTNFIPGK
jgi:hypothetical protein